MRIGARGKMLVGSVLLGLGIIIAIFSHYSGVPRREGRRAGEIRIVARHDLGWFWLIPISDALMSVGVVLPRAVFDTLPRASNETLLEHTIADTPAVAALMQHAVHSLPRHRLSGGRRSRAQEVIMGLVGTLVCEALFVAPWFHRASDRHSAWGSS